MSNSHEVVYLPIARLDLSDIVSYMQNELKVPLAAEHFLEELDKKVELLSEHPYLGAAYKGNHRFAYEYRRMFVGNFTIFYVILETVVEIHRIIYSARNMEELI
jgi:plasmid stabilization system protein ParE